MMTHPINLGAITERRIERVLTREGCMELALHQIIMKCDGSEMQTKRIRNIRERAKAGLEGRDPSSPDELAHVPPNRLLMAQLELSGKETDAARAERDALAAELKALRERSGAAEIDREKVRDAIAEALGDMIFCCTRQWSAWRYGTMSQNDFVLASEDDGILDELTDAAVSAIDHAIATAGAPS